MSILWKHFSDEGFEKVRCNYCSAFVSYKKGNRSIMRKHLERKHPEALGINTQAMTEFLATDEDVTTISDIHIHPIFQIENNIQYFIQMIYERPTLYEYSRLIGWNSKQNKIIWQEVSDTFQVDVLECQKFWKYLKETYYLHSRNPKLDDHKYANELSFLGEMYKKRRQRKEELAKQRKLFKPFGNMKEQSFQENIMNSEDSIFTITKDSHEEDYEQNQRSFQIVNTKESLHQIDTIQSIDNYEIYEQYNVDAPLQINKVDYTNDNDQEYKYITEDVNELIVKDTESEVFYTESSLLGAKIISLNNASTQTDDTYLIHNTYRIKNDNLLSSTKCKKCTNELDELDLLMEFIKGKIRKFSIKDMNKLQINILKMVMEAEKDNTKNSDIL